VATASRIGVSAAISNKERAVVSGGAGFIGSHLCEALLARGLRVLALDNFITGSHDNVRALVGNPDFEFRQANVNERVDV
jgi:nucleoside-diphosphate-sugar epimerase